MQIDIYLREKRGDREIRFPIIPEEIAFKSGDAMGITYEILGVGEVVIPTGTQLDNFSWKSEFPGKYEKVQSMWRGAWAEPSTYDATLRDWLKNGTVLNLLVTGYPINTDVYIKEYHSSAAGAFGDIYYEIGLVEARSIVVTTTEEGGEPDSDPAQDAWNELFKDMYDTYVVVEGDTLWGLAERFYGNGIHWRVIYEANEKVIESEAKRRGMDSSYEGLFIFPGTTFRIPRTIPQEKSMP